MFRPRGSKDRYGRFSVSFLPAVSDGATKSMRRTIRSWRLHRMTDKSIEDLACIFNPVIRGWINYYSGFTSRRFTPHSKNSATLFSDGLVGNTKSCTVANARRLTFFSASQNRCLIYLCTGDL